MSARVETPAQREDRLNTVVIETLKVTTKARLTTSEAIEVAIRLTAGIAFDAADGKREVAAVIFEEASKWMLRQMRDQHTETVMAVKDGERVQ